MLKFSPTSNAFENHRHKTSCGMSLLDHLWDDTVAGPRPSGLNKLHRSSTFSSSAAAPAASAGGSVQGTRSITILRSSGSPPDSGSEPSSPASAPDSPRTPTTPRGDWRRLRRKPAGSGSDPAEPRSPTVHDWVVINALDR